jgi:hypothetical protein
MVHLLLKGLLFLSGRDIMLTRYRCIYKEKEREHLHQKFENASSKNINKLTRLFSRKGSKILPLNRGTF